MKHYMTVLKSYTFEDVTCRGDFGLYIRDLVRGVIGVPDVVF